MAGKILYVACGVLRPDTQAVLRAFGNIGVGVDTKYLEGGLHSDPPLLRRTLQAAVDEGSSGEYDSIAIGYGMCGSGAVGIAARTTPLYIPLVHDCIALFLGSDAEYRKQFANNPGTYYVSAGWYDEKVQPRGGAADGAVNRPGSGGPEKTDLTQKYGDDNAEAITEFMDSWKRNYSRSVFIDTGAGTKERYASYAKALAEEFGWNFERVIGDTSLLEKLLLTTAGIMESGEEILKVPSGGVTVFDSKQKRLSWVVPVTESDTPVEIQKADEPNQSLQKRITRPRSTAKKSSVHPRRAVPGSGLGIGIDAGGTYTDAAVYVFETGEVISTGKALTTKWDYTVGISEALQKIDPLYFPDTRLVCVSTTLATNAIVEGKGQKVGLILMPPGSDYRVEYEPNVVIRGGLDISGRELEETDRREIIGVADKLIDQFGVRAFAVSGYAGSVNPAHELEVKKILEDHAGKYVCCGHELSGLLDFRVRANTAVLNAGIIPLLERFLADIDHSLSDLGIDARVMVVKGDGSLMSTEFAKLHPVETALSGPAASISGAQYLCGGTDALVVDVGGTTTDIGKVQDGRIEICEDGALVGSWRTHVQAVDMVTLGLGGDSEIVYEKRELKLGPARVTPIAWLADRYDAEPAIEFLEDHADDYSISTRQAGILFYTGKEIPGDLSERELRVLEVLQVRPYSLAELATAAGIGHWSMLPVQRLIQEYIVQPAGLTPTDAFHVEGVVTLWNGKASERVLRIFSQLSGMTVNEFIDELKRIADESVLLEIVARGLDIGQPVDQLLRERGASELLSAMLNGGNDEVHLSLRLRDPVIGLGAPAGLFLERPAQFLNAELIVPEHAEVANAVGAVTSNVHVHRSGSIVPDSSGTFILEGVEGDERFDRIDDAEARLKEYLQQDVLKSAWSAGTASKALDVQVKDRMSFTADGVEVFLGRSVAVSITGPPNRNPA